MLYISDIRTVNIKSHKDVYISSPAKGIVRFKGPNNNGKSVIVDVLEDIIACRLHNPRKRLPYISYEKDEGHVTIKRSDGAVLHVNINKEASKTFYRLQMPGSANVITRYLADKNLRDLIDMFGFHWDEKREMSLNIYKTYTPLIFVTTSETFNYDLLTSVITDSVAESAKEQVDQIKKQFDGGLKAINQRVAEKEIVIANMKFYNEEELAARSMTLRDYAKLLVSLGTHDVPDLKASVDMKTVEALDTEGIHSALEDYNPVDVKHYKVIELLCGINKPTDIRKSVEYYLNVKESYDNGVCFACGRRYTSRGRIQSHTCS